MPGPRSGSPSRSSGYEGGALDGDAVLPVAGEIADHVPGEGAGGFGPVDMGAERGDAVRLGGVESAFGAGADVPGGPVRLVGGGEVDCLEEARRAPGDAVRGIGLVEMDMGVGQEWQDHGRRRRMARPDAGDAALDDVEVDGAAVEPDGGEGFRPHA
jgi:hypothetical protein